MLTSCLQFRLGEAQRREFAETGMLIVEQALSGEQVEALTQPLDRIFARQLESGHDREKPFFYPDFLPDDPLFVELVDYERTLPLVWGILGWNIYLYHAHLIVTPPCGRPREEKTFGWHQDSGRVNVEIESRPRPRLSIKIGYFLSDASVEGRGNFWVVPGSHRLDDLDLPSDSKVQPQGAVPVLVKPGTAVIFDRRLWHTATPNWSDVTRKVLFYGYGYRWLRTKDNMTVQPLWAKSAPIRRQLLGDGVNANGHYSPTDEDVPLRVWLREHCPEDAG